MPSLATRLQLAKSRYLKVRKLNQVPGSLRHPTLAPNGVVRDSILPGRQAFTHVFRRVTDCPVYIARHPDTDGILARAHQRGV
jgi:hypothetical protein